MGSPPPRSLLVIAAGIVLVLFLDRTSPCYGGKTSFYARKVEKTVDMPLDADVFKVPPGYNAPQQVHITQGDRDGKGVIVSWVTANELGSSQVIYWKENSTTKNKAEGKATTYTYFNYTSGYIHHCTIHNLEHDTQYYYEVGIGLTVRQFWFITPPEVGPDAPYTFGLIGDLGQTYDSNRTLTHYEMNPQKGQTLLFVGDLSYADDYPDHDNNRWDTWGRFVERSAAYQPWILTAGNHEIDFAPELGETKPFKPFTHRYRTPFKASDSTAPFWYSVKRGPAYIIVLSSYSAYTTYTPQYLWLEAEFPKVNRTETPWLIVLMHCPLYNSYNYHYMEGETMRVVYEPWFVQNKVDVVFAGHVHAYERSERVSNIAYNIINGLCTPVSDQSAPVYITIGDGGNIEGLATNMTKPQPKYSAFREASFGHAIFDIKNRTHAYYSWHRNQDGYAVEADRLWFNNRYWHPVEEPGSMYHVPYEVSGSTNPLWYSIKCASAYIVVQSSYSGCAMYTPQYDWLQQELPKVNRTETPWLIVLVHSPWYNSYNYHYIEGESMRVVFEQWIVQYKVDVVFARHVHAYERTADELSAPVSDTSAPVNVTIGNGGNIEGLAFSMTAPQPNYSIFRESSFGHCIFDIKNRTHAYFGWHRNEDNFSTLADFKWFHNRVWYYHVQESD